MMGRQRIEGGAVPLVTRLAGVLTPAATTVVALAVVAAVGTGLDLWVVASVASVAALCLPLWTLCRERLCPGSAVTPVLAAFVLLWVAMLASVELLSAVSQLGSRVAWVGLMLALAVGLQVVAERWHGHNPRGQQADLLCVVPLSQALREPWAVVVVPLALVFGALFAQSAYLNLFTGINHTDGQTFYMARSIRYLQGGTLAAYGSPVDFLPHFHQTVSAYLLLFFGAESSILLLSSLFGGAVCLALFDLSRLLRFPVSLALLAGLSPLSVTIFSLHLGTSNFDVHMALFLLLVIYFLVVGMRTSQTRYLLLAASATSLALATKLTFWFAAPGLAMLWAAVVMVLARRRGLRGVAPAMMIAALIVVLGGLHFLRNARYQGFLITPNLPEYGQSNPTTLRERFDVTAFNLLASTTTLLTPVILAKETENEQFAAVGAFQAINESLGISLPNPLIFTHPDRSWADVFDHFRLPFHSDKAGFGTIIPFVVAPSALFVVVDGLRRRRLLTLPTYLVCFALFYLLTLGLTLKYAADHVRYLIEMVVPLLALVPAVLARLPIAAGLVYLAVAGGFMAKDAYQAYRYSDLRPPSRVMLVPREIQYPAFNAVTRYADFEGARVLDQRYPVDAWPELFLLRREQNRGEYFEYPYLDVAGRRRLTGWATDLEQARPSWPGPMLVVDPVLAQILNTRFPGQVVLDRLSSSAWVGLPLDRLRVLWRVEVPEATDPIVVRIGARVDPERYRRPEFRFTAVHSQGGEAPTVFRDFSPDPTYPLPWGALSPVFDLQVEVREAGTTSVQELARVPQRIMFVR
jgi:hypothetical protein